MAVQHLSGHLAPGKNHLNLRWLPIQVKDVRVPENLQRAMAAEAEAARNARAKVISSISITIMTMIIIVVTLIIIVTLMIMMLRFW